MQGTVEITFKDINKTPEYEQVIREKIDKLEKFCNYMISCRVIVERPQKYPDTANPYRVRIYITVPPSHEIIAKESASQGGIHDNLLTVINRTFHAAERQLKELNRRLHGEVKTHPQQQVMGIVHSVSKEDGYGFIKTVESQEDIYFHKNSVLHHDYERMEVGTGVRFTAEQGEKGLQASSVEIVFKPGVAGHGSK